MFLYELVFGSKKGECEDISLDEVVLISIYSNWF